MTAQRSILVVEDNEANQMLARALLELEGYRVDVAADSAETIELLKHGRPDLILMDLQLPGLDGLALTRQLKADPAVAGVPIVALTARAMVGDREQSLAAGCIGYIPKPIDMAKFGDEIKQFLEASGSVAEAGPANS
jgi:two-component system, cell cycle response regulator DivK